MFQYFPSNYVWSLSVNIALEMGVAMGEIDAICRPLLDVAKQGDDEGTATFFRAWRDMGDQLSELAAEDEQAGRLLSAGAKLNRAAAIYLVAERMHAHGLPERTAIYQKGIESFLRGVALSREPCRRVEIPYGDKHIVGLFVAAENAGSVTPSSSTSTAWIA